MISNIKAIIIACSISIISAYYLASSAESNSRLAAANLVLKQNNSMQQQFYGERESMKEYVSKLIDRNKRALNTGAN